ncbi:MAG TPA: MFS transporter [Phenylobacterium sp.]|uniref:spinster family MFS transporter n=1 Tax=Phenylobacterium sp. TaxID=1871053 RepID=UPI002CFBB0D8|nr:MFS transporter [Phenylobacterium sp.]HSV02037.1 MFS transporter [Phenylobacterium sp.]
MTDQTATAGGRARPTPAAAAPARPHFSERYKLLVLALLVTAYTFNFIDRTIIATIGQKIKEDLRITDTQLGLLGGLFFALLYTFLGIPLARLAERVSRVNIIALAIVVWSGFTALCGTAANFATLAAYRFGVGVGEAGLSPSAHSLISDYYEPKRRASALAVYSFGIPLGSMLGAIVGGQIVEHFSWRAAFMVVGLPGLAMAAALKLLVKEPPRGHSEPERPAALPAGVTAEAHGAPMSLRRELAELGAVVGTLFGKWPVFNMVMGVTLVSMAGYGGGQFSPPYFLRAFHLSYGTVGLVTGLVAGIGAGAGTLIGGFLTDRLAKRHARWYALVPAIGIALSYPFNWAIYTSPSWTVVVALLVLPGLFSYTYLGPTFGVIQNMVSTRRRATATAILFFFLNLIGLGGGPPLTGWMIDHLAAFHFARPDLPGLWQGLSGFFAGDVKAFQAACPGGVAPSAAGAAAAQACHGALVLGTRQGILIAYAIGLWGALHYLLAAPGLKAAMARARAERGEAD